jgi:UDP-glucose 4-epimerase
MTRWLVTGGCGFIGRNLISRLMTRPDTLIRVVDDLSVGTREQLATIHAFSEHDADDFAWRSDRRLGLVVGNVCDEGLSRRVADGADVVVHLAANTGVAPSVADPRRDCFNNVVGTLNYLEACRHGGIRRFVFASSGAPIGNCEPPLHEELPAHPVSPYGASKLAGEAYCSAYKHSYGLDTVALRFGNCYGPLSTHKSSVVAKFIRESLAGTPWEIFGGGEQTRDFIFVDDVTDAILLAAAAKEVGGEVFQIATNTETTVVELANLLAKVLKLRGVTPAGIRHAAPRIGDVKRNYSDTRKARTRLGWSPRVTLEDGLDRTAIWFLETQRSVNSAIDRPSGVLNRSGPV